MDWRDFSPASAAVVDHDDKPGPNDGGPCATSGVRWFILLAFVASMFGIVAAWS